ncbi:MAG: DUF1460 domain-containing protein [Legionella sp.]|nr:DUF1460 domain-containing protein [Legionella sp.]
MSKKDVKHVIQLKFKTLIFALMMHSVSYAIDSKASEQQADQSIQELYHRLHMIQNTSIVDRIIWFSDQFKGANYELGSLGEGPNAHYDQFPRYRVDAFDCETYVTTVLSLASADSLPNFKNCLKLIRYKEGKVSYINRHHFTSVDWNQNNQQQKILKDITLEIKDKQHKPIAIFSNTLIDKSKWYTFKPLEHIRLLENNEIIQKKRLEDLKNKGSVLGSIHSKLPYLPFSSLFEQGKPRLELFSQIPNGAIIEIIRPNWDLRQKIGTSLDVSHLGFAIWNKGTLYFRQASSVEGKVIDIPMIKYLRQASKSPTIKGINVQIVLSKNSLGTCI